MHGETGTDLEITSSSWRCWRRKSHLTGVREPRALLKRKSEFMRDAKREFSYALAAGKALQFNAAISTRYS